MPEFTQEDRVRHSVNFSLSKANTDSGVGGASSTATTLRGRTKMFRHPAAWDSKASCRSGPPAATGPGRCALWVKMKNPAYWQAGVG